MWLSELFSQATGRPPVPSPFWKQKTRLLGGLCVMVFSVSRTMFLLVICSKIGGLAAAPL